MASPSAVAIASSPTADSGNVDLVVLPTAAAIDVLTKRAIDTNAVLHLTC